MTSRLRKVARALIAVIALGLSGCGGGGGGTTTTTPTPPIASTATPVGTTINLAAFKGVLTGTAAGSKYDFPNLTGTDSQGRVWTGSHTLTANGVTVFESQNVTQNLTVTVFQFANQPSIDISYHYFLVSDGSIYKLETTGGTITVPLSQTPFPSAPKVGDSGSVGTFRTNTDTTTVTWALNPDINGASQLVLSYVTVSGLTQTISDTLVYTYFLDATGIPTKLIMTQTQNGLTVNISGIRV